MVDDELSSEEQEELEQTAKLIAKALAEGQSQADVTQKLIDNGWESESASHFVGAIATNMAAASSSDGHSGGGSGAGGWLIWIGILLFINLLSWLFDWPFWIY